MEGEAARLHASAGGLNDAWQAARLPAPLAGERDALVWQLETSILPRLLEADAPVVAALFGSTGTGKSTLFNSLAGQRLSATGITRPVTSLPVILAAPADGAFLQAHLGSWSEGRDYLLAGGPPIDGLVLVDTPDVDSVVAAHREITEAALVLADLLIFVTTPERYADAVPWAVLEAATNRGAQLIVVLNRAPEAQADVDLVVNDLRRSLSTHGLKPQVLTVGQHAVAEEQLPATAVAALSEVLERHASSVEERQRLRRQALGGSLRHLVAGSEAVLASARQFDRQLQSLVDQAHSSFESEERAFADRLARGELIRADVLRRWEEFLGVSDLTRFLSSRFDRMASAIGNILGRRRARTEVVGEEAGAAVGAMIVRHVDRAADETVRFWEQSDMARPLLAARPDLQTGGHSPALPDVARAAAGEWLAGLAQLVARSGAGKRDVARAINYSVNGMGLAAMIVAFSATGGVTGAEVGIAAGSTAASHKLLEWALGKEALRRLVDEAARDLRERVGDIFTVERDRYLEVLEPLLIPPDQLDAIAFAHQQVEREAKPFLKALQS